MMMLLYTYIILNYLIFIYHWYLIMNNDTKILLFCFILSFYTIYNKCTYSTVYTICVNYSKSNFMFQLIIHIYTYIILIIKIYNNFEFLCFINYTNFINFAQANTIYYSKNETPFITGILYKCTCYW